MKKTSTNVRWIMMFLVFLISTVSYLDRTNLSVSAPVIQHEFHISAMQLGIIFSAFSWTYALGQIPAGMIANWLKPRKTYFYGMLVWCIILILTTQAASFGAWVIFRIPFGLAEAVTWPAASVLLARWFPRVEYSQAMSLQNLGLVIGAAVAPPIVAFLLVHWGWQVAFIITGIIAAILGVFFYLYGRDNPEEHRGVSENELEWIKHDQLEENSEITSVPGLYRALLKRPTLWAASMANFGLDFVNYMFLTWYPTYLTEKYHMSLSEMGIMAMEPYLFGLITVLSAGTVVRRLVDKGRDSVSARKIVISLGLILGTATLFVTPFINNIYASVTCMSLGYAFVMSILGPMWSTAAEIGGKSGAGFVSGAINFIGNIGGILSPLLMGFILQYFNSFTPAILISAGITLLCSILFLILYRVHNDRAAILTFTKDTQSKLNNHSAS
ncbi:MFS transporter [Bacillus ginsengihumi]|uniref:MFS transporter n=2 Tax=Heyndrickxia ginsengihumi TaxID=363870 RepID=A0A6M0P5F2_9BACI|nr:MFS transporter [Heyndrickxia ginsengihumi]MCM3023035.1 MFS transporter [Heyndrickxia ginsengihumi]NEY19505.1 MFS transporter [Heyndrickxia ginsengihumi]